MNGLSLADARRAMSLGWPEPELKVLSAYLRAKGLAVGAILSHLVEVRAARRLAFYRGTPLEEFEQLVEVAATPAPLTAFTDGSGTHDASAPAGAGVALFEGERLVAEVSLHMGNGTNNHAELSAVAAALRAVPDLDRELVIWSDSTYAIEACSAPSYSGPANAALITLLRADVALRPGLTFRHLRGHQRVTPETPPDEAFRIAGNARADALAGAARRAALGLPPKPEKKPREPRTPKPEKQRPIGPMKRTRMPRRLTP